jgi:hypothetical protein
MSVMKFLPIAMYGVDDVPDSVTNVFAGQCSVVLQQLYAM